MKRATSTNARAGTAKRRSQDAGGGARKIASKSANKSANKSARDNHGRGKVRAGAPINKTRRARLKKKTFSVEVTRVVSDILNTFVTVRAVTAKDAGAQVDRIIDEKGLDGLPEFEFANCGETIEGPVVTGISEVPE